MAMGCGHFRLLLLNDYIDRHLFILHTHSEKKKKIGNFLAEEIQTYSTYLFGLNGCQFSWLDLVELALKHA